MQNNSKCFECESKYAVFDREPDCENCPLGIEIEELDSDNDVTMRVWELSFNQVIMGFNGAVDINLSTVLDLLKLYNVSDDSKLEIVKTIHEVWRYFNDKKKESKNTIIPKNKKGKD